MTSDLCAEDVVVRITAPQIISSETIVPVSVCPAGSGVATSVAGAGAGSGVGGGAGGSARVAASSAAVELGRRLLLAARAGDTKQVLDLMAKGAPFTTDWLGTSALHLAAGGAHLETCAVLVRAGVSRDARTKVERTPLHLAAAAGHAHVAALLLDHGALVDCRDMLRMTPLHWAVERGHVETAAVLMRHGADPGAESKFHKTPLGCARAHSDPALLRLLEDALREREANDSVHALHHLNEQMAADEQAEPQLRTFDAVQRLPAAVKVTKTKQQEKTTRTELKTEQLERVSRSAEGGGAGRAGEGAAGAGGRAAALLRAHGITLLPPDDGTTVLSALQSGRTVVLSDAGKLMLKESGSPTPAPGPTVAPSAPSTPLASHGAGQPRAVGATGGGGGGGGGVVLTATPVRSPPRAGVKIFTLNNRLLATNNNTGTNNAATKETNKIPIRKVIDPRDMQVKFVQLPPDTKILSPSKVSAMKAKTKVSPRPAVKIIMNKSNFHKLMANANANKANVLHNGVEVVQSAPSGSCMVAEEGSGAGAGAVAGTGAGTGAGAGAAGSGAGAGSVRAQLAAAQRALAALTAELHACKARLALYEPL